MIKTLYMAPMLVYTDSTFREVYFRHFSGFDRAVAPFIVVAENSRYRKKSLQSLLPSLHETIPVEPQILSKDPDACVALANLLEDAGFKSVNINMACPADAVVNKGRGSGFLPHPERVQDFLASVIPKIRLPLSVKVRTGLYSHREIEALIPVFNAFPLSEVMVHPRLGVDKYEGSVDLEAMKSVAATLKHPLVFSGDVSRRTWIDFSNSFKEVDRWMIGRELLRDPFLPEDIRAYERGEADRLRKIVPLNRERKNRLRDYHDDLLDTLGKKINRQEALVGKMKSYWQYLEALFPGREAEMEEMKRILHLDEYNLWVNKLFKE